MNKDRLKGIEDPDKPIRFKLEKFTKGYEPEEGSLETVLMAIKDLFSSEMDGGSSDGGKWDEIETKASLANMTIQQACFQYYLAGRGHMRLARIAVEEFDAISTGVSLGSKSVDQSKKTTREISDFLYEKYPDAYKQKIKK